MLKLRSKATKYAEILYFYEQEQFVKKTKRAGEMFFASRDTQYLKQIQNNLWVNPINFLLS